MNDLSEQELSAALHDVVAEPDDRPGRVLDVRRRAQRLHRQRVAAGWSAVAVTAAIVAVPALVLGGLNGSTGPAEHAKSPIVSSGPGVCATPSGCARQTIPDALRRPVRLPRLSAGQQCPVSGSRQFNGGGGFSGPFAALGPGPAYLAGPRTVRFAYPPPASSGDAGTGWGETKVILTIDRSYSGPLLLRGAQIDGGHGLRFDHYLGALGGTTDPKGYRELAYPAWSGGPLLQTYPSILRLQAPGCYGVQVDGLGFSETIVFRAQLTQAGS